MGNSQHWVAFERIVTVLLASGALHDVNAEGMMHATPLGLVARDLQAKNPLWLAMALLHPAVQVSLQAGVSARAAHGSQAAELLQLAGNGRRSSYRSRSQDDAGHTDGSSQHKAG